MATKAYTPAELASNIAFLTAKKTSPKVSTTPAPLQSLLKPKQQQPQATSASTISGLGLPQVNNPIKSAVETPKTPSVLPSTGAGKLSIDDFANKIKEKYPQYKDKDNKTLAEAMINKYPEYRDKVDLAQPSTAQNIAGGVVKSGLDSILAEPGQAAIKFLGEKVTKPLVGLLPESGFKQKLLQNVEENIQGAQKPQETLVPGASPESKAYKGAKLVGDIIQTVALPGPGGVTKGAGLIKGAGQLAKQGAIETAKFTAISDKRLPTPTELAIGTVGNVALGGAIKGLGLVGKYLPPALKKSAEKSVSQALAPTGKKMKQITEKITPEFLKKGIRGSQETIRNIAKEGVENFGQKIDDAIEGGALDKVYIPRQTVDDVLTLAKESTMVGGKVVNTVEHKVISEIQDMISQFPEKIGGQEARGIKSILDRMVYATKGGIGAEDLSYKNTLYKQVADTLRRELSKANPNLANLNKEFSFYKNLFDIVDATIKRQKPQTGGLRKFAGAIVGGNTQGGPIDKILGYIGTKLFLDATSSATRNTLSAKIKNKVANMIAIGDVAGANAIIKKQLALPYKSEGLVFQGKRGQIGNAKPTVKTPPIVRETGNVGVPYATTKQTPQFTKNTTNAPTVGKIKVPLKKKLGGEMLEQNISKIDDNLIKEAKKYKSADEYIEGLEKEGKVLYHGTDADIDIFSNDFIGKGGDSQRREGAGLGKGIYLTNKLDEAKFYAKLVNKQNTNTRGRNDMGKHQENIMSQLKEGKITKAQAADMFFNGPEATVGKENIIKTVIDGKLASKKDIKEIFGDNLPRKYIDDGFGKKFQIIDQEKINKLLKDKGFIGRSEPYTMAGQQLGGREMSDNIVIFDPASIKTESQLRKIREQANKLSSKKPISGK